MYTVYAGDRIIYHPELVDNGYAIYNPVVTLEANKSGSFQFTMPVTNVNYNNLQKMSTIITVMNDGDEIFRGRILNDERDFNNNKIVYCEGELSFLLDSIVRPYDYDGTIRGFFGYLVANHNTQVEANKQFIFGNVTVLPDTPFKLSITDYVSTWYVFNTYLLDVYGGYIRIRLSNGLRYLDYVASYENINAQTVAFGTNMLDLSQYVSAERIFTNLIPLGSTYAVELDDSEITVGQLSKTFTEPIGKKNESSTPFIFALEVLLNSKSKANGTSNITVKYSVKTKDNSTASWSGLDGTKVYADIQLDPGIEGVARVNQKVTLPAKTINGTEQVLVTWTGNVATGSLVITGEFINNYTKSTAAAGNRPISNSMATVSQLLQQKYLKTTIATVNNNLDYLTDATAEGLFGKIVAVHTWDDVDDPAELKSLGEQYLADNISMAVKLDVNAVDLNLLNVAYEKFKIGDRIRVVSAPHVLDDYFTCTRITLDLQHPDNNTYRLGREFKTLTETQITAAKDIQVTNEMIAQINNSLDAAESVVEQMNQLINTIYDKYADVTTVINNLDAAYADIDFANIQDAAIANLVANQALITALDAAYAQVTLANIDTANIDTANVDTIVAGAIDSGTLTTGALYADYATVDMANIADAAITNLLAKQILVDNVTVGLADINFANITQAAISQLVAGTAQVQSLGAYYADLNFSNINNAAISHALVDTGLFSSLTINNDVIVGGTLNAASIAAGSIVADKLILRGTDGLYYELNMTKKDELIDEAETQEEKDAIRAEWARIDADALKDSLHGENIIANTITAKQIHAGSITAQELAVLDATDVTFQDGQNSTTMHTFMSNVDSLSSIVSSSVSNVSYRYFKSTSATEQPDDADFDGPNGSDTMPVREDGKYIWRRTTVAKNSGTNPDKIYEMIQGADGATGPQGPQGETGPQGPQGNQGVSITKTEPLWFLRNTMLDIPPLNGNTEQAGSSGKNLIGEFEYYNTSNYYKIVNLSAGDYTLSFVGGEAPSGLYARQGDTITSTAIKTVYNTKVMSFTVTTAGDYFLQWYKANFTDPPTQAQLERGSTATAYEPHLSPDTPQDIHSVSGDNTVKVVGKNLLNLEDSHNYTAIVSKIDSGIRVTSNSSSTNRYATLILPDYVLGKTITFSADVTTSSTNYGSIRAYFISSNYQAHTAISSGSTGNISTGHVTKTITIPAEKPSGAEYVGLLFYAQTSGTMASGLYVDYKNVQVEISSSETFYAPYVEQVYPISLPVENLFDKNNANTLGCTINYTYQKIATSENAKTLYIPCSPNTTYTISKILSARFIVATTVNTPSANEPIMGYTNNDNGTVITITTDSASTYLCVYYFLNGTDTLTEEEIMASIQIEKGAKANSYTPYGTPSIELNKIGTNQDYIYKDSNKWYVHKAVGHLSLVVGNMNNSNSYPGWKNSGIRDIVGAGKNTSYSSGVMVNVGTRLGANTTNDGDTCWLPTDGYNGLTQAQWVEQYPSLGIEIYVPYTTTVDVEITDDVLTSQLDAISKAVSYDGSTNILQVSNDLPFIFTINTTATETPARPTTEVIISSRDPEVWSLSPATYIDGYRYYTTQQTHYSDNTVDWSEVVPSDLEAIIGLYDTITETTEQNTTAIIQLNDSISLKADSETVTNNYNTLNGKIDSIESTIDSQSGQLDVLSTQISGKVSSSEVSTMIDNVTGQMKTDISKLQQSALTIESDAITRLVSDVDVLEKRANSSAVKVKADGTYIYKGVADAEGNVTLDELNYTKIDTTGQHTYANGQEVSWNSTEGGGAPQYSIGDSSSDAERWTFSRDGDLLNIRWIDNS